VLYFFIGALFTLSILAIFLLGVAVGVAVVMHVLEMALTADAQGEQYSIVGLVKENPFARKLN